MGVGHSVTLANWLAIGQFVITSAVGVFLYISGRREALVIHRLDSLEKRCDAIDQRIDKGGGKVSDLASEVQGLPDRLRTDIRRENDDLRQELLRLVTLRNGV
jgi:hypothetical protein